MLQLNKAPSPQTELNGTAMVVINLICQVRFSALCSARVHMKGAFDVILFYFRAKMDRSRLTV